MKKNFVDTSTVRQVLSSLFSSILFVFGICNYIHAQELPSISAGPEQSSGMAAIGFRPVVSDSFTGAMSYSVPIEVPAGRKGVQPQLALSYRSGSGNGWLGVGWSLSVGAIELNTKFGVKYTGADDYVLHIGGTAAELVAMGNNEYRAKVESGFYRVRKLSASGGLYWEVTDKNGTRYLFGQTAASRQDNPADANQIFKWCLDKVEDTNGNYMTAAYEKNPEGKPYEGEVYLKQIDYTGNGDVLPTNYVKFNLEGRADDADLYAVNFRVKTAYRLKTIEVMSNRTTTPVMVRKYELFYDTDPGAADPQYSASTGRSLLTSVRQYGSDGSQSLPEMKFDWSKASGFDNGTWPSSLGSFALYPELTHPMDVNGDGRQDLVLGPNVYGQWFLLEASDNGLIDRGRILNGVYGAYALLANDGHPAFASLIHVMDVNGDGRQDIVLGPNLTGEWFLLEGSDNGLIDRGRILNGAYGVYSLLDNTGHPAFSELMRVMDVNGDGRQDIVLGPNLTGEWFLLEGSDNGLINRGRILNGVYGVYSLLDDTGRPAFAGLMRAMDVNGDGRQDIVLGPNVFGQWFLLEASGSGFIDRGLILNGVYGNYALTNNVGHAAFDNLIRAMDVNGDGRQDIVLGPDIFGEWFLLESTGKGFVDRGRILNGLYGNFAAMGSDGQPAFAGLIHAMDVNGDGRQDLVLGPDIFGEWFLLESTGKGFADRGRILSAYGHFAAEVNGDGQLDFLGLIHIMDVNGDGRQDVVLGPDIYGNMYFVRQGGSFPDLLTSVDNGFGGNTSIEYSPSTHYTNTQLPFPIQTVRATTVCNNYDSVSKSCEGTSSTTTYSYEGGFYHIQDRDFRGFNHVTVKGPVGPNGEQSVSETWFHQGNDAAVDFANPEAVKPQDISNNPYVSDGHMKGKPYFTQVTDGQGRVYSKSITSYESDADGDAPYFNPPQEVHSFICEAGVCGRHLKARYEFDHSNGNVLREYQFGDVNDPSDDRTIVKTYSPNTAAWILELPASETIYQGIGTAGSKVAQTTMYYDGSPDCSTPSNNQTPVKGNPTRIVRWLNGGTDPEVRMAYDAYGNLICTRDANGNPATISYDSSFTFPKVATNALGYQTTTQYYGVDGIQADKGLYGQVKSVTDLNGQVTTTEYDVFGRVARVIDPYGTTSQLGTVSYFYENFGTVGQQKVVTYTTDQLSVVCPSGYTFNSTSGKCEKTLVCDQGTYNPATDKCEYTELYTYPAKPVLVGAVTYDKPVRATNGLLNGWWIVDNAAWAFPIYGYVSSQPFPDSKPVYTDGQFIRPAGPVIYGYVSKTSFTGSKPVRDYFGLAICDNAAWLYPVYGHVSLSRGTVGGHTEYTCPSGGTLSGTTCTATRVIQTDPTCSLGGVLNPVADVCMVPNYIWKSTYFDGLGRTIKTRNEGPDGKVIVSETLYNATGAVSQTSVPYFEGTETLRWMTFTHDALGRTIRAVNPDGTSVQSCYNAGMGVVVSIDANGHQKRSNSNAQGKLIKVEEYLGTYADCTTDPGAAYATTLYEYDVLGNLLRVFDAEGNETRMQYDTLGRKIYMKDPDMGEWTYGYDANGNLISQMDPNLRAKGLPPLKFEYDSLNRVTRKDYPTGTDVLNTYDEPTSTYAIGRLTTTTDASGTTKLFYDKAGRTTKTVNKVDGVDYTTTYIYDALGRMTGIQYPDNETVGYGYDTGGNLSQVTGSSTVYAAYTNYNALGQPGQITFGNGVSTTYQYAASNNRLTSITTRNSLQDLFNVSYTYDNNGNIMGITDTINAARSQTFIYDDINRLIQAQSNAYGALFYIYSQIGNISNKEGMGYSYGLKPHAVTATSDGKTYTYDPNGNMISDGQRAIAYDYDNMPQSVTRSGVTTSFVYDGGGARVKKTGPNGTTIYIGKLYECKDGVCSKFIFAGGTRIALKTAADILYYHQDHLGSSRIVTDKTGNKVEEAYYLPFGAAFSDTGAVSVNHKYTSQEFDTETGLYYYNARYYNPVLGRFISADTIVPNYGDPQTLNRYTYCRNNPLLYADPSGNIFLVDDLLVAVVVGAAVGAVSAGAQSDWNVGAMLKGAVVGAVAGATGYSAGTWAFDAAGGSGFGAMMAGGGVGGAAGGAAGGAMSTAFYGGKLGENMLSGAAYGAIGGVVSAGLMYEGVPGTISAAGGGYASGYAQCGSHCGEQGAMYAFGGQVLNNVLVMTKAFSSQTVPKKGSSEWEAMHRRNDTYVTTPSLHSIDDILWNMVALLGNGYSHSWHTQDTSYVPGGSAAHPVQNDVPYPPNAEAYNSKQNFALRTNNCTTRFGYTHPGQYYSNYNYAGQGAYWWAY